MFNNISWTSYWSVLTILTIIYYLSVLLIFFGSNIRNRLAAKTSFSHQFPTSVHITHPQSNRESGEDELFPLVQSLIGEMTAYLEQAGDAVKEEIIFGLQQIFKKYSIILNSSYQEAIENLLLEECETKRAVHLSDAEIKQVWMG